MSMMSTLMTVMRKELRDLSRPPHAAADPAVRAAAVPVLLLGMGKLAESRVPQIEEPLQIRRSARRTRRT
jgi:sodium transport system permease protein